MLTTHVLLPIKDSLSQRLSYSRAFGGTHGVTGPHSVEASAFLECLAKAVIKGQFFPCSKPYGLEDHVATRVSSTGGQAYHISRVNEGMVYWFSIPAELMCYSLLSRSVCRDSNLCSLPGSGAQL